MPGGAGSSARRREESKGAMGGLWLVGIDGLGDRGDRAEEWRLREIAEKVEAWLCGVGR